MDVQVNVQKLLELTAIKGNKFTKRLTDNSNHLLAQLTNQSTNQPMNQYIHQSINQSKQPIILAITSLAFQPTVKKPPSQPSPQKHVLCSIITKRPE